MLVRQLQNAARLVSDKYLLYVYVYMYIYIHVCKYIYGWRASARRSGADATVAKRCRTRE